MGSDCYRERLRYVARTSRGTRATFHIFPFLLARIAVASPTVQSPFEISSDESLSTPPSQLRGPSLLLISPSLFTRHQSQPSICPSCPKMNDADVSKQIQQMVKFIRQEAEEKANEISVSAEEEFNIEKLQLVEAEKRKIRQEYDRKEKQVEIRKKIEYSMQLNASRLKVLQAQDDLVNSMKEAAGKELLRVSHDHHAYKKLLKELIVQSLLRLKEPAVLLRCRKDDLELVKSILHSAKDEYAEKANVHPPDILIDTHVYLPPAPSHHHAHGPFCSGGVVLASRDGKIVCENTLDARLDVVFRKKLPEIRKRLFGQLLCYYFTSLLFRIAMGRRFSAGIRPKWVMWVILSASLVHASVAGCNFTAIFNFGDSNSDTGGFWAAFPAEGGPFGMTYFKKPVGRASDGRLIVDFFAQSLGLPFLSPYLQSMGSNFRQGANYATLASTVLMPEKCLFDGGLSPFFLAIQLNQMKEFKAKVIELHPRDNLPPPDIFSQSLYTLDIGQNDFTSKLANIGIDGVKKFLPEVVNNIVETVKALYAEGGRTFLVFNLRPIGCYPAFLAELPYNSSDLDKYGCLISYNNAVVDYNTMLKVKLNQTRSLLPDTSLIYVDIHSVTLELYQHPAQHGLLYGTKSCCGHGGGAYNFDPQLYCGNTKVINGTNVTATACGDPQNYVSWDGIHASEAANKLVTSAILSGSYFDPPFPLSKLCDLQPIG